MVRIFKRIPGFHGPFHYPNGRVLYLDRKINEYYDPLDDVYVSDEEAEELRASLFKVIAKDYTNDKK